MSPPFIIFSAPRCGSTAVYRALNILPGIRVAYEPAFDDLNHSAKSVNDQARTIFLNYSGIKHVFDPTGYPFQSTHQATIAEMEKNRNLWTELNSALLNYPKAKIIFLRRRNGFERILSDLVGRATNKWGHSDRPISNNEVATYKDEISKIRLPSIDATLIRWYLTNLMTLENDLIQRVKENSIFQIFYEDIFGPQVPMGRRLEQFEQILHFLLIRAPRHILHSTELSLIVHQSAKLNDGTIYERIPNYGDLMKEFSVDSYSV